MKKLNTWRRIKSAPKDKVILVARIVEEKKKKRNIFMPRVR